jgi:hypothetical protein
MCFEFEWLYWAQTAQDEEQRRKDAANRFDPQQPVGVPGQPLDPRRQNDPQPLHA